MMFTTPCRVCGSLSVELFLDLGDQPHCNRLIPPARVAEREPHFPLRAGFCHTCTLVQIDHTIPKASLFSDYPYVSGTTATLIKHFRETAARLITRYGLEAGQLVVDIGSNDGTWLAQYQPHGLRVLGIDPAENVAALALQRGVPTWPRFFDEAVADDILKLGAAPKLVTAAGVFFHLEDLHSVVRGVAKLISNDGVFVVQAIYLGGMIENIAFDQIYHEHLVYYTLKSIEALFSRHGLEVFDVDLVAIHGGSIEVHVAPQGRMAITARVHELRAQETARALDDIATYRGFARDVANLRRDLTALLHTYRAAGKSVYAFGAPAKGATLLNSFAIGPDLVGMATERNAMKVGHLMPGSRIPIVGEDGPKPDAFLVLAWNFIDEFVEREGAYLDAGGEFIVPVPTLKVIRRAAP